MTKYQLVIERTDPGTYKYATELTEPIDVLGFVDDGVVVCREDGRIEKLPFGYSFNDWTYAKDRKRTHIERVR
jgi:hypothetical protein